MIEEGFLWVSIGVPFCGQTWTLFGSIANHESVAVRALDHAGTGEGYNPLHAFWFCFWATKISRWTQQAGEFASMLEALTALDEPPTTPLIVFDLRQFVRGSFLGNRF